MANFHTDMIAELAAITEVADLCGPRVKFITGSFNEYPAITLQRVNDSVEFQYGNSFAMNEYSYQVDIYATSYEDLSSLSEAVLSKFRGFTGPLNSNVDSFVNMSNASLSVETFEDDKTSILRAILDVTMTTN